MSTCKISAFCVCWVLVRLVHFVCWVLVRIVHFVCFGCCSDYPDEKTNTEVQMLIEVSSKPTVTVVYAGDSVTRDQSSWRFTAKQGGRTIHEDSGANRVTAFSLTMAAEAIIHAVQWLPPPPPPPTPSPSSLLRTSSSPRLQSLRAINLTD